MSAPEEPWWTVEQLAEVLGKKVSWINDQCEGIDSDFPHHRVGRDLRFSPEDRRLIDQMTSRGRGHSAGVPKETVDLDRALRGVRTRRRTSGAIA